VSFGRTMMQAMELLRLAKRHSQSVSQLVENSTKYRILKFRNNFLEGVRNDLKEFLSLVMPNLYCLNVTK